MYGTRKAPAKNTQTNCKIRLGNNNIFFMPIIKKRTRHFCPKKDTKQHDSSV